MTIPGTYLRNTTGGAFTTAKTGGVALGINSTTDTSDGEPITTTQTLRDNALGVSVRRRNVVVENTGVNVGAYNATVSKSGGTFAYFDNTKWIMRRYTTTINGTADTSLLTGSSDGYRQSVHTREKMFGAKVLTAWRNRGWQPLGVSGQRSNYDASATGVNTNGILDTLSDTYKSTTNNAVNSSDDAIGTDAVPGELTYHYGALAAATTDEYKARTLT